MRKVMFYTLSVFAVFALFGGVETASAQRSGSMEWRGTVDDVVEIRIRNRNARTERVSGREYNDDRYNFEGRAPRGNADVRVQKTNGRGRVSIVQQPNRRNDFTTVVRITDSKGGADRYRFTLYWD